MAKLGLTVIGTFALCWWPYLTSTQSVLQVGDGTALLTATHHRPRSQGLKTCFTITCLYRAILYAVPLASVQR